MNFIPTAKVKERLQKIKLTKKKIDNVIHSLMELIDGIKFI